ncbi:MAG: endonuclease NucS [Candidatus Bathyarchaeota archaeon]|nr:MAG: endonuclease NucS [Candidatus Bathyarchaeota archaeon]
MSYGKPCSRACRSTHLEKLRARNNFHRGFHVALENPTVKEAAEFVRNALSERKALIIVGNCWVEYQGRASSKLESGERIIIIKDDGSVLVHRPAGYEPVNWQPPGCLFQTRSADNVLEVKAVRRKPSESVRMFFDRIYLLSSLSLVDRGKFSLYASEEDMQRAILFEPEILEHGFKPITYEKKVEPGFVDIYGIDKDGKFVVVEIKRKTAGRQAALQLAKYVDAIKAMVNREVRGILVAPRLAKGTQRLLATLKLDFKALDPRRCSEVLSMPETKKLEEFFG